MSFLSDNCIREIKEPKGENIFRFDYSSKLNLVASFEFHPRAIRVWNPDTGEILREIELFLWVIRRHLDVIFLPGRCIATNWVEQTAGIGRTGISVFSIGSGKEKTILEHCDSFGNGIPQGIALTSDNKLLHLVYTSIYEYSLDFETMKIKEKIRIWESDICHNLVCYSPNNRTIYFRDRDHAQQFTIGALTLAAENEEHAQQISIGALSLADENAELSVKHDAIENFEEITHYFIKGEIRQFDWPTGMTGLAHDGENIIVATYNDIIVLELASDGSDGHVLVSHGIEYADEDLGFGAGYGGNLRATDNGKLMVCCYYQNVIKVYEYKRPDRSLKGQCRQAINKALGYRKDNVRVLNIPNNLKKYLLYQTS